MKRLLVLFIFCFSCKTPRSDKALFQIEYQHPQAGKITVLNRDTKTIFQVQSPFGIGKGKITLIEGTWPKKCILRLYLKGLEGLSISSSGQTLDKPKLAIEQSEQSGKKYFDVTLPKALLSNTKELEISWVDFYR